MSMDTSIAAEKMAVMFSCSLNPVPNGILVVSYIWIWQWNHCIDKHKLFLMEISFQ